MDSLDLSTFFFLYHLSERLHIPNLVIVFIAEDLAYILLAVTMLYLVYSAISRHEKIKATSSLILSAMLSSLGVTQFIRLLWHRPRPFVTLKLTELISETSYSFPSAHSALFFALSTIICFYNKKLGAIFFVTTALICLGRILAGVHYPSDIIGGLIVGVVSGIVAHHIIHWFVEKHTH